MFSLCSKNSSIPVGKIAGKAVWHCILSTELTKTFQAFFDDFAHWDPTLFEETFDFPSKVMKQ